MVWREPKNHTDDCYFCMVNMAGFNRQKRKTWSYPNLESALRPVPHSDEIPIPIFKNLDSDEENAKSVGGSDEEWQNDEDKSAPNLFSQGSLNDLVRDLALSKEQSELLASRLFEH